MRKGRQIRKPRNDPRSKQPCRGRIEKGEPSKKSETKWPVRSFGSPENERKCFKESTVSNALQRLNKMIKNLSLNLATWKWWGTLTRVNHRTGNE